MRRITILSVAAATICGSLITFTKPTDAAVVVKQVESEAELCEGRAAAGVVGDFVLKNDLITVVISNVSHKTNPYAASGGNIVDAAGADGIGDEYGGTLLIINNDARRVARYTEQRIEFSPENGDDASLVVTGADSGNANIKIETRYTLAENANCVMVESRFTNTGSNVVTSYSPADAILWGDTDEYVPGHGFSFPATVNCLWHGAAGKNVSYGWTAGRKELTVRHLANGASAISIGTLTLEPGQPESYQRFFVVGMPDLADVMKTALVLSGKDFGTVAGTLAKKRDGVPVAGARVDVSQGAAPLTQAISSEEGNFSVTLPQGEYGLLAQAEKLQNAPARVIVESGKTTKVPLEMKQGARLRIECKNNKGKFVWFKLVLINNADYAKPVSPPGYRPQQIESPSGKGEIYLQPGRYTAIQFARANGMDYMVGIHECPMLSEADNLIYVFVPFPENSPKFAQSDSDKDGAFDFVEEQAGTDPNSPASIPWQREIKIDTDVVRDKPEWYVGETHCHTLYSDGVNSVPEIIKMAEDMGLDFLAITDHRTTLPAFDPEYHSDVLLIPGEEWGTRSHATVLGIRAHADYWENDVQTQFAINLFRRQGGIFILNHPADTNIPWTPRVTGYHGIEVRAPDEVAFWEERTAEGERVAIIGSSDRHGPTERLGHPGTAVYAENLSVPAVLDAIRNRHTCMVRSPDGAIIDFRADPDGDGVYQVLQGDVIVPTDNEVSFKITIIGGKDDGTVVVVSNSAEMKTFTLGSDTRTFVFADDVRDNAWYRVDLVVPGTGSQADGSATELAAISSAIYVGE